MTHEEEITLAQWKDLALKESLDKDELAAENERLKEHITAKPAAPAAPPPPLDPIVRLPKAPPPPLPAWNAYIHMSSPEKAAIRAAHKDAEDAMYATWENTQRISGARGAASRSIHGDNRLTSQIIEDREAKPPTFDPSAFVGRPIARTPPNARPLTMQEAELASRNQALASAQAHAKAAAPPLAPPPPTPLTGKVAKGQKTVFIPR